jgi:phenylalanyl-tRNA synthetase alpha chain
MAYSVPKLTDFSTVALDSAAQELRSALNHEWRSLWLGAVEVRRSSGSGSTADWQPFRNRWVGRKRGILAQLNEEWLKRAPADRKRDVGQLVNELKTEVEGQVDATDAFVNKVVKNFPDEKLATLEDTARHIEIYDVKTKLAELLGERPTESLDITLPGVRRPIGAEHPVIKTMNEIIGVFRNLGYSVEEGPEIETDYYNFEALNFPPNHPARDTQDTLFIAGQDAKPQRDRLLLRTHTSPVQIHTMQKMKPPVRVVCPGKVHRNDALDATHSPIFHQVEGLAVDTNITFCDLKGTLDHAMKALFGSSVKTRFYPSFFPFTEPSADVQISCIFCGGKGVRDGAPCRNCKASGWIELLGCGMVDPNVYGFVDYDASKVSGFAFGMGVERIAILKYGVDDIQMFFQGDVRFLEQFG